MELYPLSLQVLVNDRPVEEYLGNDNNKYIEGRKGSEFKIRIINRSYRNLLAVPSVDGLSIFDGKPASKNSRGYILKGYETIDVPGWTLDNSSVAKFEFSNIKGSYSEQSGKGNTNVGVIGVMAFYEKEMPRYHDYIAIAGAIPKTWLAPQPLPLDQPMMWNGVSKSIEPSQYNYYNDSSVPRSMSVNSVGLNSQLSNMVTKSYAAAPDMGTSFGDKSEFRTTSTVFNRQDVPVTTLLLYYGSREYLRNFGIEISRKPLITKPVAFPGDTGCTPPPNWRG